MNLRRLLAQSPLSHSTGFKVVRARARLAPAGSAPRVLINSVPKAGTHLLSSILDHTPGYRFSGLHVRRERFVRHAGDQDPAILLDPEMDWPGLRRELEGAKLGQYATAHLWASAPLSELLSELDYRVLYVTRDPRDIVVSTAAYIPSLRRHRHHQRFKHRLRTDEERMLAVIRGFEADADGPRYLPLADRLRVFVGWEDDRRTLRCRFEDMVGARGAGNEGAQEELLARIFGHLGLGLDAAEAAGIAAEAWASKSATFRSGRIGAWRQAFTPAVAEAFEQEVDATMMAALGYPTGDRQPAT